jgi:hypothetical protein
MKSPINSVIRRRLSDTFGRLILIGCLGLGSIAEILAQTPVVQITPGTTIDLSADAAKQQERWNLVVLLATPQISSGDTDKLSDMIRNSVSTLTLTILGTVRKTEAAAYELTEIGIGYSIAINGKLTVINSESAFALGAKLGFIANRMLKENEGRLPEVVQVVQASNMLMFDAPGLIYRDGKHQPLITRHLCWIDAATGKAATLVWLLEKTSDGTSRFVESEPLRLVPTGTVEERGIHVDGSQFFLGIPNEQAFALEELPPGTSIPWIQPVSPLVSNDSFTQPQLTELATYLNQCITAATRP